MSDSDQNPATSERPTRHLPRRDMIVALCVAAASIAYIWYARDIRQPRFSDPMGPRAFPYLIGALGLVSAIWLLIESFLRSVRAVQSRPVVTGEAGAPLAVVFVTVWSLLFYIAFERIGFPIGGTIYLLVLTMVFNRGAWLVNTLFSIGITATAYVLFSTFLGVPLPDGPLGF